MPGAGGHDRYRAAVQGADQFAAVGDEVHDRRLVVGHHHAKVKTGGELALSAVHDHRSDLVVVFRLADRGEDAVDHVEGQGVGLSVVEVDDQDLVAAFGRDGVHHAQRRSDGPVGDGRRARGSLAGLRSAEFSPDVVVDARGAVARRTVADEGGERRHDDVRVGVVEPGN